MTTTELTNRLENMVANAIALGDLDRFHLSKERRAEVLKGICADFNAITDAIDNNQIKCVGDNN